MAKTLISKPTPAERLLHPFQEFLHQETSGGIILLFCTIVALVWANSPWQAGYHDLWHSKFTIGFGDFQLSKDLLHWINDGLMAVFFFVVGLEIKREMQTGELSSRRKAALPIAAAIGGMIFPALIYSLFNAGGPGAEGWGIPMATDIAFALGVLALLGKRVPTSLKVFLTALAIVDDLGAVLVIAIFYTAEIAWLSLAVAAGILVVLLIMNRLGVRNLLVYALLGVVLWFAFLKSGVHATIAGVLLAMTIPSKARIQAQEFVEFGRTVLSDFEQASEPGAAISNETQQSALQALETAVEHIQAPLQRLEHSLHPWVAFAIMPIFALANAGVSLGGDFISALLQPVSLGVTAGLVFGKQIGISLFVWLASKLNLVELPGGVTWRQIYGASWLAGIGFTMSLFIAGLAFGESSSLTNAKAGILLASLIAGVVGWFILRTAPAVPGRE